MVGVVSILTRILAVYPYWMYMIPVGKYNRQILRHPELRHAPYNPLITPILQLAVGAGVLYAIWGLLSFYPSFMYKSSGLIAIGLGDLAIFALMMAVLIGESKFLPLNSGQCRDAEHYQVGPDHPSLFRVLNATAIPDDLIKDCRSWVVQYYIGMTLLILVGLSASSNLFFGSLEFFSPTRSERCQKAIGRCCSILVKPLEWFFKGLGAVIVLALSPLAVLIAGLVWILSKTEVLLHFANRVKAKYGLRQNNEAIIPPQGKNTQDAEKCASQLVLDQESVSVSFMPGEKTAIELRQIQRRSSTAPWLPFDIMVMISRHLHHIDVVNLGMTCKSVRAALGGLDSSEHSVTDKFARYACTQTSRVECWGCGTQTCASCQQWTTSLETNSEQHASTCKASCLLCMRKSYVVTKKKTPKLRLCSCPFNGTQAPTGDATAWNTSTPSSEILALPGTRFACRLCAELTMEELLRKRTMRDKNVQKCLSAQPESCHWCKKKLASRGPLFWQCTECKMECTSCLHPQWRKKVKAESSRGLAWGRKRDDSMA